VRIVDLIEGDAAGAGQAMSRHLDALERRICLEPAAPTKTLARMLGFA
jgi:DNA-binding FadR family transcriptional regulator